MSPNEWQFNTFDLLGVLGALAIATCYLLYQIDFFPERSRSYHLINAAGSLLIIMSLLFSSFNFASFTVEVLWVFASLLGYRRCWKRTEPVLIRENECYHNRRRKR